MLKRIVFIVCFTLSCICANAFSKLSPETSHFISLHGDLGYSALLNTIPGQQHAPGLNTNIGADYRLFHNNFLFSIGLEGMYDLNANMLTHMVNLNLPLLFGGEWGRFYFLMGPKFSLNLYGSTSSVAQITTYGDYERAYDDFYDMPNHQFVTGQQMGSATMPMKWNFNIMAHLELGGRVSHMYKHKQFRLNPDKIRMYLAFYADFGILNLHVSNGGAPLFDYRETEQGVQFYLQPLMCSAIAENAIFRNLNIGIKYTVAFELPKPGKSFIYDYYKVGRNYRKRGGTQSLKY